MHWQGPMQPTPTRKDWPQAEGKIKKKGPGRGGKTGRHIKASTKGKHAEGKKKVNLDKREDSTIPHTV